MIFPRYVTHSNELSTDIIVRVANSVATDTLENIEKLNETAKRSKSEFIKELQEKDRNLREELDKQKKDVENMKSTLQSNYKTKLDETTTKLNTNFDERFNAEMENLKIIYKENIESIKTEHKTETNKLKEHIQRKFQEDELKKKKDEFERITKSIKRFNDDSKQFVNSVNIAMLILCILIPTAIFFIVNNFYILIVAVILPILEYIIFTSFVKGKFIRQRTRDKCDKILDMEYFSKLKKELNPEITSTTLNIENIYGNGNNFSGEIKSINQNHK